MGAKKLYSDAQLLKVVDQYFGKYQTVDIVSPEAIAKFATEELGMLSKNGTPLSAKLFRRNEKVMNLLKSYNEDTFIPDSAKKINHVQFTSINMTKFVKTYKNKPKMMVAMLTHQQELYRNLMDETITYEKELNELREKYIKLELKLKEIKEENKKLAIENKNISNFKEFTRDMKMLNYLVEKGYISSISDANIELAGKRTGIIEDKQNNQIESAKPKINIPESVRNQVLETVDDSCMEKTEIKVISVDEVKAKKAKSFWDNLDK